MIFAWKASCGRRPSTVVFFTRCAFFSVGSESEHARLVRQARRHGPMRVDAST